MNTANPTRIRVGMTGTFAGKAYTVIARVVMGMDEDGETYFWNEFYLSDGSDRIALLVCEEVYGAQQWRLFTEFAPPQPMPARAAGLKRVGDRVEFDGISAEVTVVDESRVHHIEGKAPDWVIVGDVAQYFNAEAAGKMWVVSWSGDEVEYYRGMQLHGELVAQALGLPASDFSPAPASLGGVTKETVAKFGLLAMFIGFVVTLIYYTKFNPKDRQSSQPTTRVASPPAVLQRAAAPPPPLKVGTNVVVDGRTYQVATHRVTGFTRVNRQWNANHYQLTNEQGSTLILLVRPNASGTNWHALEPFTPTNPPTPLVAGALRVGDRVTLDDFNGVIGEIFMSNEVTRTGPPLPGLATNGLTYHYLASGLEGTNRIVLASWNGSGITFLRGRQVDKPVP